MKIICELRSRYRCKVVTTHELDVSQFGANLDNPFPCSDLYSFTVVDGSPIRVIYQVSVAA